RASIDTEQEHVACFERGAACDYLGGELHALPADPGDQQLTFHHFSLALCGSGTIMMVDSAGSVSWTSNAGGARRPARGRSLAGERPVLPLVAAGAACRRPLSANCTRWCTSSRDGCSL